MTVTDGPSTPADVNRDDAVRRAVVLNRFSIAYNSTESVVALAAGFAAISFAPALHAAPCEINEPTVSIVDELVVEPPTVEEAYRMQQSGRYGDAVEAWSAIVCGTEE